MKLILLIFSYALTFYVSTYVFNHGHPYTGILIFVFMSIFIFLKLIKGKKE